MRDEDQQLAALDWERVGTVDLTPSEPADLGRIRDELA